jgi:putative two-component system response regulator
MGAAVSMNGVNLELATIMMVDDEEVNLRLLRSMLSNSGYKNLIATRDPREVLGLYQAHEVDLILLDINMPYLDGYQVMQQLVGLAGEQLPPIMMLTAQSMQEFRQRALDSGARDYVTKPFDARELLSRVRNLLEVQLVNKYMRNQNEILEARVAERTVELQNAHAEIHASRLQIVRRLGLAAEYKDEETGLHIIRMSKISALLGQEAGLDTGDCDLVLNAAPMHDIGKIGIPDHILRKPGKFEPHEWEVMKTHTLIGADILSGDKSPLLVMAREIAISHHEKWDGSGYPYGLRGDAIPLVGRIIALADVFDALTSVRPYKKAWSTADALDYIRNQSGKHFDPALVRHFQSILDGVVAIKEEYAEPAAAPAPRPQLAFGER